MFGKRHFLDSLPRQQLSLLDLPFDVIRDHCGVRLFFEYHTDRLSFMPSGGVLFCSRSHAAPSPFSGFPSYSKAREIRGSCPSKNFFFTKPPFAVDFKSCQM